MMHLLKRLFKKKFRWICEYCGNIIKSHVQPYCKPCCHIHNGKIKMIKIKGKKTIS